MADGALGVGFGLSAASNWQSPNSEAFPDPFSGHGIFGDAGHDAVCVKVV